jgi:uncharacterized membrane protein
VSRQPLGIVLGLGGLVVLLVSAFANQLGIGEDETFGWLQITAVVVGAAVLVLGVALAWVPWSRRSRTQAHA